MLSPATEESETPTLSLRGESGLRNMAGIREALQAPPHAAPPHAAPPDAAPPDAAPPNPDHECPKCGGKLIDPESLGWCAKCGYCRSLEQDKGKVAAPVKAAPHKTSPLGVLEFIAVLKKIPPWGRVLLGGLAGVIILSVSAHFLLPRDSLARALWTTIQLALGLIALLVAQVWSLVVIGPHDSDLGIKDIIISARLWGLTIRRLPDMRKQVWVGAWSLSMMICGLGIVGGLSFWFKYYKPKKMADTNLVAAVAGMGKRADANKSLSESVEDLANKQDLTKEKLDDKQESGDDKRPTVHAVIIGYTVDDDSVASLMIATLADDKLRYAGVVKKGLTPEDSAELLSRLKALQTPTPPFPNLKLRAIWVKPEVLCEVRQSGYDEFQRLRNPRYAGLLQK